jgi:hypothetical protein
MMLITDVALAAHGNAWLRSGGAPPELAPKQLALWSARRITFTRSWLPPPWRLRPEPPARKHRALRKALVLTCDDDDEPFAWWVLGPPPAAYVPAGVIRPKPEEKPPRRHGKRRTGWAEYAHYIPRQWQSDHARDMFLAAEAVEREPGADRPGCAQDD